LSIFSLFYYILDKAIIGLDGCHMHVYPGNVQQESPAVANKPARRCWNPGHGVTQRHRKWHHSIACLWFPISVASYSKYKMHRFGDRLLKLPW